MNILVLFKKKKKQGRHERMVVECLDRRRHEEILWLGWSDITAESNIQ